jgi:predicted RNA-binding Zn-ribbon protein involved in translation (DUF1610 family)
MADISMTGIGFNDAGDRTLFDTGVSTVGRGGDDYFCGHCGRKMIHNMDLKRIEVEVVYVCGGCGGYNLAPKAEGQTA